MSSGTWVAPRGSQWLTSTATFSSGTLMARYPDSGHDGG